jgi:hypothetical protein
MKYTPLFRDIASMVTLEDRGASQRSGAEITPVEPDLGNASEGRS